MDNTSAAGLEPAGLYRTEPPDVASASLKRRLGEKASSLLMPLIRRAARPYLGGETADDALCVVDRLTGEGLRTSLSYWDDGKESLGDIESIAGTALAAMTAKNSNAYLALKPPALRFSPEAAVRLAHLAAAHNIRLHFDSHGADVADRHNAMLEAMLSVSRPELLGTTLPGRLQRTSGDADWAVSRRLPVRVVKGEWPDPADPHCDLRARFLAVIDCLAGRASHVAVATHDEALGREAITKLRQAGTSCEVEVLLGMPARALTEWAKRSGVPVRIYVPYGCGFIPNDVGVLRRNPRLALTIAKAQMEQWLSISR